MCPWRGGQPCGAAVCLLSVGRVQGETRQDKTRQDTARHDASSARRYYHHDHDAVRLTLQPDRRACEPDPDPKPDPEPEPEPEPGRRRQTRARHSLIPSAGASGTTAAKSELEAAAAAASCASCSVQCSPVSSCTAATAPGTSAAARDNDSGRSKRATRRDLRAWFVVAAFICMRQVGRRRPVECVPGAVLLVLHCKASGRTFSRTQSSCCTCCPEQPSVQPPHLSKAAGGLS